MEENCFKNVGPNNCISRRTVWNYEKKVKCFFDLVSVRFLESFLGISVTHNVLALVTCAGVSIIAS